MATTTIDHVRILTFLECHRIDDPLNPPHVVFRVHVTQLIDDSPHARNHFHDVPHGTQLLDLPHLQAEVIQRELTLLHLFLLTQHVLFIKFLLSFFEQRHNIAHAQNSPGHTVGMEFFQSVELFADPDEFDWYASDSFDT